MRRPGQEDQRGAGCCLFFFGMPFIVSGMLGFIGLSEGKQSGSQFVFFLTFLFPLIFAGVGGGMMYWGVRQMRAGRHLSAPLPVPSIGGSRQGPPSFPPLRKRSVTPRGRVRLPHQFSPGQGFLILLIIAVIWNGLSWGTAYGVWREAMSQTSPVAVGTSVFAVLILGVFCLVGLLILFALLKQIASWLLVGQTWVELSGEPVAPGSVVSATLHQAGDFEVARLTVFLVCTEEAEHGSGKQRKTSREEVHREAVLERRNLRARHGQVMAQWELRVPSEAMHSFSVRANRIRWTLEVKMGITGRPDVDEKFEFRVGPGGQ